MVKRTFYLLAAITFLAALQVCFGTVSIAADSTLERAQREGVIRIGTGHWPPFAYMDVNTGQITGESAEIIRHVMKKIGVDKVDAVIMEWDSLIPALKVGRSDIIAGGMYILPSRCKEVAFTNPTLKIGTGFVVSHGNPEGLHSFRDVAANSKAILGVVSGAAEGGFAKVAGVPEDRILSFPNYATGVAGLQAGRIHALAVTSLNARSIVADSNDKNLETAKNFSDDLGNGKFSAGYGAFAVRKEDTSLLNAINKELATFVGSHEYDELRKPFGFTSMEAPEPSVKTEMLCSEK